MRVLVTGGAGFVGANLSIGLAARHSDWEIIALDNLHRAGSKLNLPRLEQAGVRFVAGDVRRPDELAAVGAIDALVECSAEPSVLAGIDGSVDYVVESNLFGAYACLELCRAHDAQFVFLSTSRVYPHGRLAEIELVEEETRLTPAPAQRQPGVSEAGIAESFPLDGPRTLYGATKLSAEHLAEEYAAMFGLRTVVDRFGVIAGPWQMGKVDQGVLGYWVLAHHFGRPLQYIGYGGKQVRDMLHVDDAVALIERQLLEPERFAGAVVNAGGGAGCSTSLLELTDLCREVTGRTTDIETSDAQRPGDIPYYVSDCARLFALDDWRPERTMRDIVTDTAAWVAEHERDLAAVFA